LEQVSSNGDLSLESSKTNLATGIPPALSFDRIIDGGTCPPCTVRDFMNYLIYVERSAENLQFFLWYRSYCERFKQIPEAEQHLSPEWTPAQEEDAAAQIQKEAASASKHRRGQQSPVAAALFKGTDFEKAALKDSVTTVGSGIDPFSTPPLTPPSWDQDSLYTTSQWGTNTVTNGTINTDFTSESSYRALAGEAYTTAGANQPFTIQPFRNEVDRIIATYIMDRAPRQLNLSAKEQKTLLHALSTTTHPSAFRSVAACVESSLRHQAHPNFIRWSICNGNPARVSFARFLGVAAITLSTVLAIVLTLSKAPRGYRALAAIGWMIGVSTMVAAAKGMCIVLHGLHHRHLRPWELFVTDEEEKEVQEKRGSKSFETVSERNSYEDEPWVVKYNKRNLIRKVFDREVWVQEPMLRQIQDTIFIQSILCAFVASAAATALFVAVPAGNFF
jgi:hypothetical protein